MMAEISAAGAEQTTGNGQVGDAVQWLDQVTQQNVTLVEESAAAAESLKVQAQQLVQAVAVFKLSHDAPGTAPSTTSQATAISGAARRSEVHSKPVRRPVAKVKSAPTAAPNHVVSATVRAKAGEEEWSS